MSWLPLSFRSEKQRALVFGVSPNAERKIRLLERASVAIERLSLLSADGSEAQGMQYVTRIEDLSDGHFKGVTLAVAASDDLEMNRAFAHQAKKFGIPTHVAEDAQHSDFLFPALIERGPISVAVSSAGEHPTLTRLIRSRVESVLPARLGVLAQIAGSLKEAVKRRIPNQNARRAFWESNFEGRFADLIFNGKDAEAEALLTQRLDEVSKDAHAIGEVYLVGAGPGDPDLLSFKALRLMRQADTVLYDRLVSKQILGMVRQDADLIDVGKSRSNHTVPQEGINELLASLALQGKRVLRLKGGDPFIFGRGGEEIELLAEKGIPFQVVPGITAAAGCASYAGIPLTHRDYAQSVRFVTGHLKNNSSDLVWKDLVGAQQTLVFYMGLVALPTITQELIRHGLNDSMPVAVVSKGTLPEQKVVTGTLSNISEKVVEASVSAPTIIIIGDVVSLHDKLSWK